MLEPLIEDLQGLFRGRRRVPEQALVM